MIYVVLRTDFHFFNDSIIIDKIFSDKKEATFYADEMNSVHMEKSFVIREFPVYNTVKEATGY